MPVPVEQTPTGMWLIRWELAKGGVGSCSPLLFLSVFRSGFSPVFHCFPGVRFRCFRRPAGRAHLRGIGPTRFPNK